MSQKLKRRLNKSSGGAGLSWWGPGAQKFKRLLNNAVSVIFEDLFSFLLLILLLYLILSWAGNRADEAYEEHQHEVFTRQLLERGY